MQRNQWRLVEENRKRFKESKKKQEPKSEEPPKVPEDVVEYIKPPKVPEDVVEYIKGLSDVVEYIKGLSEDELTKELEKNQLSTDGSPKDRKIRLAKWMNSEK